MSKPAKQKYKTMNSKVYSQRHRRAEAGQVRRVSLAMAMSPRARVVAPWAAGSAGGGADLEDQPWAGEVPNQDLVIGDR